MADSAFPFLRLPGETRNQIYRDLLEKPEDPDGEEVEDKGRGMPLLLDTRHVFSGEMHRRGMRCGGLLALMRTCRAIYHESSSWFYCQLRFRLNPGTAEMNMAFVLSGPGRQLRSVAVQSRDSRRSPVNQGPTDRVTGDDSDSGPEGEGVLTYEERILRALAARAHRLEHLEIQVQATKARLHEHRDFMVRRWGVPVEFPDYSYVDPPLPLPGLSVSPRETIPRKYPTDEQRAAILEYLAPGDRGRQVLLEQKMRETRPGQASTGGRGIPHYRVLWNVLRRELVVMEGQKLFLGRTILQALEGFGPSLRTVECVGIADTKWMGAVADLLGVRVCGRLGELGGLGESMVVVPSSELGTD